MHKGKRNKIEIIATENENTTQNEGGHPKKRTSKITTAKCAPMLMISDARVESKLPHSGFVGFTLIAPELPSFQT